MVFILKKYIFCGRMGDFLRQAVSGIERQSSLVASQT
jgi:hypothetical protein